MSTYLCSLLSALPRWQAGAVLTAAALLAGCASQPAPQGYGVAQEGMAAEAQRQMQQAEQSTQVATTQTYLGLITQMQQAGQWYASLAHTEAFEQQYGSSTQIKLLRADALRNTDQWLQARKLYTELTTDGDKSMAARAHQGLGLLDASNGLYAQAIAQLEKARQLAPIDANVLSDLAYAHMLDGQLAPAQLPVLQAAQLAPGNARVQLNLALYWLASGKTAEARHLLQQLLQPQPNKAPALIDDSSLQTLESQLSRVHQALQARAHAAPAAAVMPAADPTTAQTQAYVPAAEAPAKTLQAEAAGMAAPTQAQTAPKAQLRMETQIISSAPGLLVTRQVAAQADSAAAEDLPRPHPF